MRKGLESAAAYCKVLFGGSDVVSRTRTPWMCIRHMQSACVLTRTLRALRTVHRPTRAALCTGKYAWGRMGSTSCPVGTTRISGLTACQSAAAAAGRTPPSSSENSDALPSGCYWATTSNNAHSNDFVGASSMITSYDFRLLCAGAGASSRRMALRTACGKHGPQQIAALPRYSATPVRVQLSGPARLSACLVQPRRSHRLVRRHG